MNKVYDRVDAILKHLQSRNGDGIGHYIMDGEGQEAKRLLIEHRLVTFMSHEHKVSVVYLTTNGEAVLAAGGFEKWITPQHLKAGLKENLELEKLVGDVQKLQMDINLAKGAVSRANLSVILAAIAALIALATLIVSLLKK